MQKHDANDQSAGDHGVDGRLFASTSHTHNGPKAVSSKNKRLTSGGNNKREAAVINK